MIEDKTDLAGMPDHAIAFAKALLDLLRTHQIAEFWGWDDGSVIFKDRDGNSHTAWSGY